MEGDGIHVDGMLISVSFALSPLLENNNSPRLHKVKHLSPEHSVISGRFCCSKKAVISINFLLMTTVADSNNCSSAFSNYDGITELPS